MAGEVHGVALGEGELGRPGVAVGRRQSDCHEDHPEVHHHASVGPAEQAAVTLAAGGEHELAQGRAGSEAAEGERQQGRKAGGTEGDGQHEGAGAAPGRPEESVAQQLAPGLAPRKARGDGHEEEQYEADRLAHRVEEGGADGDLAVVLGLDDEGEDGAEQDDEGEQGEDDVVGEEGALAGDRRVDGTRRAQAVTAPGDEPQRNEDDHPERAEQVGADAAVAEGVDTVDHPAAGEKGAEDGEREGGHQQAEVPHPQHAAPLLHEHRVDVGGAGEPGQEAGVLDGVPRPHPTPAEHFVAPPTAQHDAEGEQTPGE